MILLEGIKEHIYFGPQMDMDICIILHLEIVVGMKALWVKPTEQVYKEMIYSLTVKPSSKKGGGKEDSWAFFCLEEIILYHWIYL